MNPAAARGRFPLGAKIAPLHQPPARAVNDAHIRVRIGKCPRRQINVEIEFSVCFRAHEPGIALFQHRKKVEVDRVHPDGDTANRDYHAVTLDLCS